MSHHHRDHQQTHPSGLTDDQIADYEAKFAEWQTILWLCCIPAGVLFLLGSHYFLSFTNLYLANSDGLAGVRILYQPTIWWFFPGFGALSLCYEITLQIWSLFVGLRVVDLYAAWDSRQPKNYRGRVTYYDSRSTLRWLALLIAAPIGIFSFFALPMHTTLSSEGIVEFGYGFARPALHPYGDIRRIATVHGIFDKHSKLIQRPYCAVDFADGYRWNQGNWDDSSASLASQVEAILVQHTNAPITDILVVEDLPALGK